MRRKDDADNAWKFRARHPSIQCLVGSWCPWENILWWPRISTQNESTSANCWPVGSGAPAGRPRLVEPKLGSETLHNNKDVSFTKVSSELQIRLLCETEPLVSTSFWYNILALLKWKKLKKKSDVWNHGHFKDTVHSDIVQGYTNSSALG